jgi:DNA-binding HxlR family transcriptional regulator
MVLTEALLRALEYGPMRSDGLVRRLDIDLPRLVLALRSLEGRGLVERRVEREYRLTAAGRGLL